jgi:PAS domain S-box-containing protein
VLQQDLSSHSPGEAAANGCALLASPARAKSWGAEELAAALDSVGTGIWAVDLEGRCVFVNQEACRIFGYSREECLGLRLQCILHQNNPEGWNCPQEQCRIQNALANGSAAELDDEVFLHRDGTPLPVECSLQPVVVEGRRRGAVIRITDVTHQKRVEQSLRKSNEWLNLAQRAAGVGIFDADFETGETRMSEGQFLIYGLDPAGQRLSHEEWRKLVHPEDLGRMDRWLESARSGAQDQATEFRIVWPDGSIHWLLSQLKVFFDEAGKATHQVGVNIDVTSRVHADTVFNQFFLASPTPMAIWGFDGRIQRVNPAWQPMLGFTAAEVEGTQAFDRLHPEDRAPAAAEFERLLAEGGRAGFECRARCRDGSYRWLLLDAATQKDAHVVYVTAHDITKRKGAEEALRESEAKFRDLFDDAPVPYHELDMDGLMRRVNRAECALLGYEAAEMLGRPAWEFVAGADQKTSREAIRRKLSGEQPLAPYQRCYLRRDGGELWAEVHETLVRNATGLTTGIRTALLDITVRKRAEDALCESEERLRGITDSAPDAILMMDPQGTITFWNPAAESVFGYKSDEAIGRDLHRILAPERYHEAYRTAFAGFLRTGLGNVVGKTRELAALRKDGREVAVELSLSAVCLHGEWHAVGIVRDITSRKQAEEALRAKERVLSESQSIAHVGSWSWELPMNTTLCAWTPETYRVFGVSPDTFIPTIEGLHSAIDPDDRAAMQAWMAACLAGDEPPDLEFRIASRDEGVRYVLARGHLERDAQNQPIRMTGIAQDITERKRAEAALAEEVLRRRAVFEQARDGIVICDRNAKVYEANQSFADMLGYSPEEMLQLEIWDWDGEFTREQILEMLRDAKALPPVFETRHKRKDGSLFDVEISSISLEFGGHVFYHSLIRDISARKRMEESVRANSERLARSNEELERFAYVASHDLQEPLRMVASFTQLLSKRYSGQLDETADRYINFAVDGAKRMQQLISDLLAYSRVNSKDLELRQTDCEAVVAAAMLNLQVVIEESGASVECDPLPELWVDQGQFTQLFQNLLANAIKFRRKDECPRIHISAVESGAEWTISVKDNGIGIDARHAERIFQMFQRLHSRAEYPGTGIGLAVCKKVIERHGGELWVESEPGAGSTFRFTIPKRGANEKGDNSAKQSG